jgi:hypothetical protein
MPKGLPPQFSLAAEFLGDLDREADQENVDSVRERRKGTTE